MKAGTVVAFSSWHLSWRQNWELSLPTSAFPASLTWKSNFRFPQGLCKFQVVSLSLHYPWATLCMLFISWPFTSWHLPNLSKPNLKWSLHPISPWIIIYQVWAEVISSVFSVEFLVCAAVAGSRQGLFPSTPCSPFHKSLKMLRTK